MKQVDGAECEVVFWLFSVFFSFSIFFNIKKVQLEKVEHGNSSGVVKTKQTSKMESFATIFEGFGNRCCKTLYHRCLWGLATPLEKVQHKQSATGKNCNMQRAQQEKNAKRKHFNV